MYYVGAYGDEDVNGHMQYRYVGFSKNKEAMRIYNVAGHNTGAFYEHYEIFEYDVDWERFVVIVRREWGKYLVYPPESNPSYINIYESRVGDILSISLEEYEELVMYTDIEYEQGYKFMKEAYFLIKSNSLNYIQDKRISAFIAFLFSRYVKIFKGSNEDALKVSKGIDKLQAFISRVCEESLPFYEN